MQIKSRHTGTHCDSQRIRHRFLARPVLTATLATALAACGGGGGGRTPATDQLDSWVVYSDADDGRLARVTKGSGEGTFIFLGERDADGAPLRVHTILHETVSDGTSVFEIGDDGFPSHARAANGVTFDFEVVSPSSLVLTVRTADGSREVRTPVDFDDPVANFTGFHGGAAANRRDARRRPPFAASQPPSPTTPADQDGPRSGFALTEGSVFVTHTQCGQPGPEGSITPYVNVYDQSNDALIGTFRALTTGVDGRYVAQVPLGQRQYQNREELCLRLANAMGYVCPVLEAFGPGATVAICNALAVALDFLSFPSGEAIPLIAACSTLIPAMQVYCETLGQSPGPGAPSLDQVLCDAVFDDTALPAQLRLHAFFPALPTAVRGPAVVVSSDPANFPLSLDLPDDALPRVRTLVLDPSRPRAEQDYLATSIVDCLPAGARVVLSIVGTDNYRDSRTFDITSAANDLRFALAVPGAETGVRDDVTITITVPDLSVPLRREASLVFGL